MRILIFDIETAPVLANVWGLFDQNVALNQIEKDWHVLSWSAKWLGHKDVMYADQRNVKNIENDRAILKKLWHLLNEADVVITQNGKKFDVKKINARFVIHGFKPPSSYKHIDILQVARKKFGFTSHKLEYMTNLLCINYKKVTKRKFNGFDLWKECLANNTEAWNEMQHYNKYDVLSLEELYTKLIPWDSSINFNLYTDNLQNKCKCDSDKFVKNGYHYTSIGKYQRYKCKKCGAETRDRKNLFSKEKRNSLRIST